MTSSSGELIIKFRTINGHLFIVLNLIIHLPNDEASYCFAFLLCWVPWGIVVLILEGESPTLKVTLTSDC